MRVLVFAPHRDDEVLGVGGTIAKYVKNGDEVFVCEVTDVQNNPELTEKSGGYVGISDIGNKRKLLSRNSGC